METSAQLLIDWLRVLVRIVGVPIDKLTTEERDVFEMATKFLLRLEEDNNG